MIIFDSTRRRVKVRRVFGAGLIAFAPLTHIPATQSDLEWWAANSPANLSAPDWDRMAEESAAQSRLEAGIPCF